MGYDTEAKKLDSEQLKKYILGGHVSLLRLPLRANLSPTVCMRLLLLFETRSAHMQSSDAYNLMLSLL